MSIAYGGGPAPKTIEVKASAFNAPKPDAPKTGTTARKTTGKTAKK